MPPLPVIVRRTCLRWRMMSPGDKVLVAVSGGADSVALLEVLRQLAPELGLTLAVAHLDHAIRGEAGAADAAFVAGLAGQASLLLHSGRRDVPALARDSGRSLEDAARAARYAFLRETAAQHGYGKIAVGHTLDDQAETVLLAMIRGSGMTGLSAMRPVAGELVRPLIEACREDVLAYLQELGRDYRTDETNQDETYTRNRVRHSLIPLLENEFNPGIAVALARQAELLRADEDLLSALAAGLLRRCMRRRGDEVALDLALLRRSPRALQRRVVRAATSVLYRGTDHSLSFANVEDVLGLIEGRTGSSVDLPGAGVAWRDYRELVLAPARFSGRVSILPVQKPPVLLPVPGCAKGRGWRIQAALGDATGPEVSPDWRWQVEGSGDSCRFRAVLDWDALQEPLVVRTRIPGDRFRPQGAPGERKLKEFLVDAKVPRLDRDRLPLLVDATGAIAAVLPLRAAEWARARDVTSRLLVIHGALEGFRFVADMPKP